MNEREFRVSANTYFVRRRLQRAKRIRAILVVLALVAFVLAFGFTQFVPLVALPFWFAGIVFTTLLILVDNRLERRG